MSPSLLRGVAAQDGSQACAARIWDRGVDLRVCAFVYAASYSSIRPVGAQNPATSCDLGFPVQQTGLIRRRQDSGVRGSGRRPLHPTATDPSTASSTSTTEPPEHAGQRTNHNIRAAHAGRWSRRPFHRPATAQAPTRSAAHGKPMVAASCWKRVRAGSVSGPPKAMMHS
jgi:hypothetical protein